jgi:hypothetical protein
MMVAALQKASPPRVTFLPWRKTFDATVSNVSAVDGNSGGPPTASDILPSDVFALL